MKKLAFALALGLGLSAQVQAQQLSIGTPLTTVLYVGVDNPITLSVSGLNAEDLSLELSDDKAQITHKGENRYMLRPAATGELVVRVKSKRDAKLNLQEKMEVRRLPNPEVSLLGRQSGLISAERLREAKGLEVSLPGIKPGIVEPCSIMQYEFVLTKPDKDPVLMVGSKDNGAFTPEILKTLKTLGEKDQVIIMNVQCLCPGDKVSRNLQGLSFTIGQEQSSGN